MAAYLPFLFLLLVLGTAAYATGSVGRLLWERGGWPKAIGVLLGLLAVLIGLFAGTLLLYEIYAVTVRLRS